MALKEEKVFCYQWKEKDQCSKRDQCSLQHESMGRAKPTPKAEPPSEPQSFKKRGKASRGKVLRNSIDRFVNTCTSSHCEYWYPPECLSIQRNRDVSFGAECPSPHGKVAEQQKQSRKKVKTKVQLLM